MVASAPPSAETKNLNETSSLAKPARPTKLKMEVAATNTFGDLFPLSRDAPSVIHTGNLDAQTLLDEWLANDLQQTGFLSEGDAGSASSSPSLSTAGDNFPSSPPLTDVDGSPIMDFDVTGDDALFGSPLFEEDEASALSSPAFSAAPSPMITPASVLERSPVLEDMMNLFPELGVVPGGFTIPTTPISTQATLPAGFNIPWSSDRPPAHMSAAQTLVDTPLMTPASATDSVTPSARAAAKTKATKRPAETKLAAIDDVTVKRQKNTDAARRSRLKKVMKMESLEQRVSSLEADNSKLVLRVAVLESEKTGLESKELDYEKRIKKLEQQLADAHKALTSRIIGNP